MDLAIVKRHLGEGRVFHLDDAVTSVPHRLNILETIKDSVPVVAGGGTLSRYFEPFWKALPPDQKFLFTGTGICWPYGTNEAYPLHPRHVDPRSAFRGPINPPGFDSLSFICPPGLGYRIDRRKGVHLLSVVHPQLIDARYQSLVARRVAQRMGIPLVECSNRSEDESSYSEAILVITSRLHGAVMAAANAIPCFALSRDHKLDWFCSETRTRRFSLLDRSGSELSDTDLDLIIGAPTPETASAVARLETYFGALSGDFQSSA